MALSNGPNLGLLVNGAIGEVHYNQLMARWRGLDVLVQANVADKDLATPPASPADGDTYIVAASPTGVWVGNTANIARFSTVTSAWEFFIPKKGWRVHVKDESVDYQYSGTGWAIPAGGGGGSGDVTGPASSTDGNLVLFSGTSGKVIKGSGGHMTAGGDLGIGTTTPDSALEVVRVGVQADITATTYGANGGGILHGRMANGTEAAPTGVLSGEIFGGVGCRAYHSGGAFQVSSPTSIHWVASENQTATAFGSYLRILTTPKGSTTRQERLLVTDNGVVWCHGAGTFDPRVEAQSKPFADNQFLASSSGASAAYAVAAYGSFTAGYRGGVSGGTAASPTATPADQLMCYMGGHGYSAAGWSAGTKALLGFHSAELWSDTAQGTYITLQTTPKASTARAERVRVKPAGQVRFVPMATPTVDVEAGDVYYDSATNKLRCYNGSIWNDLF